MSNKELKVKSFRVDEGTFAKFKDIASSEFGNQGQCLDALINLYETEQSKSSLITRQLEIESFQEYINKINRLFVTSLQMSEDAELRAKEAFLKKLESKDEALIILRDKLEKKSLEEQELKNKIKNLVDEQKKLKDDLKILEENKSTLTQLANRNYDLSEELKNKISKLESENLERDKLSIEILAIKESLLKEKNINSELEKQLKEANLSIEDKTEKLENEINKNSVLADEKKSYQMLIERLRSENKHEIDALESKYINKFKNDLEERIKLIEREHDLEVRELQFKIKILENNNS